MYVCMYVCKQRLHMCMYVSVCAQEVPDESAAMDDDDDAPVYNPLNIPLGWDGKPIPYWLYKLHGLGIE